jgi:RHS repeat-associated protein
VTFANAGSAATSATFVEPGEYVLKLTASDGQLSSSDTTTITVIPRNQPPTVDAGEPQTIEMPAPAELRGAVTDDALPRGATVTATWSMVSGPGTVTFADPHATATSATFSAPGTYVLQLSANDTEFTVSDDVVITVLKNEPPVVNAGADQEIALPNTVTLNGTASDDGLPRGSNLEVSWSQISGPAPIILNDAFALTTAASFTAPGVYVLRLTGSDSQLSASDEMTITVKPQSFTSRTYTLDADFDEGDLISVTHGTANELQLDSKTQIFNFIWVAVSSKGTIVKINTETGAIIGEYRTSPDGQPKDPSRTTVDQNGNVWATNRAGNSVVHVGLVENGQCVDRNNNGVIDTSTGFGDIRAWPNTNGANTNGGVTLAQDECIIHYTKVNSFGTRHVSVTKDNDLWVSGTSGRRFDLIDGKTGLIKRAEPSVGYGGYGGLIDKNGVIWSSNLMLRWDTSKPLTGTNGVNWRGYNHDSYGLCIDSKGNVWNTSYGNGNIRKFSPDGTLLGTFAQGSPWAQGCVVDRNDHVWIAHSLNRSSVGHMKNDGSYVGTIPVGSGPTGVAVDGAGKVWATNHDSRTVSRINPALGALGPDGVTRIGQVDFTTRNLGGSLYNYSDMTGSTLSGAPGTGTWTTVYDSKKAGAEWGRIGWTARLCGDGLLTVSVASSENGTTFSPPVTVANGDDPTVANGRYLKVNVSFKRASSGESPVLYDLSVGTSGYALPPVTNAAPTAFAGADQTMTLPDAAKMNGLACDDGFPRGNPLALSWSQVSGPGTAIFTNLNSTSPNVTFTLPGEYVLRLTASDGEHSVSDELTVTALPANMAPVANAGPNQTITLPNTATLSGTVSDDGLPADGTLSTFWSQLDGPGIVTFNDPGSPATRAIFPVAGTYTLRLAGNDSHRVGTDDVVITVNASPALVGATLALAPANVGPYVTGTAQPLRATLKNSSGAALANYGVEFEVAGPNATTGSAVTNASGVATFTYSGTNAGTDTVRALVRSTSTATINSNSVGMAWSVTPVSPPSVQGWIGTPRNGATVTGTIPVTVGAGMTLTQGTVEYWPASNPSAVTVLATNAQGGPGATLALLDTTLLANGNYVVSMRATDANGQELVSRVLITVAGENKPGRVTVAVTDMTVPVTGIPITIEREYDSLERSQIGDFGHGWSLEIAGPRLEVSPDHDVTLTEPGTGRRVTFNFSPTSFGFPFNFFHQPTYAPEPGVHGKLVSDGCGMLINSGGQFACFLSTEPTYRPTAYAYTDPYGRVYRMTAAGEMQSIKNLDGNVLTFSAAGITSTAGNLTVPFVRDAQGRITEIKDPTGKVYRYNYDAAGDLTAVKLPDIETPLQYEYAPGHFFRKGIDARGNAEAITTYYPDGRLESVTDAVGKTTTYAYDMATNTTTVTHPDNAGKTIQKHDANGMVLSTTDPLGRTTTYTYDANRNKRTETDPSGKTTTYDYDAGGHLKSVTDPLNKTLRYTNNEVGQPLTATDQFNKVRKFTYDADHNFTGVTDDIGATVALSWDDKGNPLTFTDGDGKVNRFTYDAYGNILSKTDALGRTTSYTYDAMGRPLTVTDARGVSRFTYDALGRMLSVIDPLSNETRYEYDANGNRTSIIDARGNITEYAYDAANRVSSITYPDGTTHSFTYNFRGQKVTETLAKSAPAASFAAASLTSESLSAAPTGGAFTRTTTYVYDDAGQMVTVIFPDLTEVKFTYDEIGRVRTVTDQRNKVTTYEYDPNCGCQNRLTKVTDPKGGVTSYRYDDAGRRSAFIDANGHETRYTYDARDRLIRTTFHDNTFVETTYNGLGRVLTNTDQEGRVTRYGYDTAGNLVSVIDAKNQLTEYSYDTLNNLTSVTDANRRTTRYEYDSLNRMIKRVLPLGMFDLYTYDQVGNLATRTDFRGKQTSYDYDPMNRMTAKRPDASLGESIITYAYTPMGRRASMTDASGETVYTYDKRDRPLSKTTPQGTLNYGYDAAGNLTSMNSSNANGVSVSYTYDDANRLETVVDHRLGAATAATTTYNYDAAGNMKGDLRPNGVKADYVYNTQNRLTSLTVGRADVAQARYDYVLDRTGRRTSATELGGRTVNYTYDAVYKLTREAVTGVADPAANGAVDYTYDPTGNRLSRVSSLAGVLSSTSTYDANDRLTSDAFDANGNTRIADGRNYAYDFENRLRSADNGAVRVIYDGDGNLAAKTVGGVTTRYLIDDLNETGYSQVVEELVGGQVQRQYTYGNTIISQRQLIGGVWSSSFYSLDGHGSVRQLTNASGAVTDTYTYDAFGKVISRTGATPNAYLYSGERFDADLGIYHLRARYYNPDRGRFMSMDPYPGEIDEPLSLHKYLYTHADPVNLIDPSGYSAMSEYGIKIRLIALRMVVALKRLARAIMCIFIKVASVLASITGYAEWVVVMQLAERLLLRHCPCKLMKVLDVVGEAAGAAADVADTVRPATQQPYGGNGNVLGDGQGATPEEIARSSGGPTGGSRRGQPQVRQDLIDQWRKDRPGQPFECWRCGHTSTNPDDMHMGHRNVPTSRGGNLDPANTVLEGAACNLSAGNRGRPSPGMSCAERGSCGAPYGR